MDAFERDFLLEALRRHDGNITKAAEEVGMYRQNFQQKMRELGITSSDERPAMRRPRLAVRDEGGTGSHAIRSPDCLRNFRGARSAVPGSAA